jgi:hypothetical protein
MLRIDVVCTEHRDRSQVLQACRLTLRPQIFRAEICWISAWATHRTGSCDDLWIKSDESEKKQLVSTGINFWHNWSVYLRASASPVFSPELPSAKLSGPQSEAALIGLSLRLSLHQLPTLTESRPSRPSSRTVGVRSLRVANQYLEESKKNDSSPRHTTLENQGKSIYNRQVRQVHYIKPQCYQENRRTSLQGQRLKCSCV